MVDKVRCIHATQSAGCLRAVVLKLLVICVYTFVLYTHVTIVSSLPSQEQSASNYLETGFFTPGAVVIYVTDRP